MPRLLQDVVSDVRFALRSMQKSVLLSATVVLTLTLAIGFNTGVFTLIHAISFRPRVDKDPASFMRILAAYTKDPSRPGRAGGATLSDYLAFRDAAESVHDLAAWSDVSLPLGRENPVEIRALLATCNF